MSACAGNAQRPPWLTDVVPTAGSALPSPRQQLLQGERTCAPITHTSPRMPTADCKNSQNGQPLCMYPKLVSPCTSRPQGHDRQLPATHLRTAHATAGQPHLQVRQQLPHTRALGAADNVHCRRPRQAALRHALAHPALQRGRQWSGWAVCGQPSQLWAAAPACAGQQDAGAECAEWQHAAIAVPASSAASSGSPSKHSNPLQPSRPPHLQAGLRDLLGQQVRFVHRHNQAEAQRQRPLAAVVAAARGGTNVLRQDGAQRGAGQRAIKVCIGGRLKWRALSTYLLESGVGQLGGGAAARWVGAMPARDLTLGPAHTTSTDAPSAAHLQRPPRTARRTAGTFAAQSCGPPAGMEKRQRERHTACIHSHASLAYIPMTSACQ